MQIADIARRVGRFTSNHSPAILAGIAIVGTVTTAYLTHKATVKAAKDIHDEEFYTCNDRADGTQYVGDGPMTPGEKLKLTWKHYIPAVGMGAVTIGSIVTAHRVGINRAAAVAAAYAISTKAWEEAEQKFTEALGPKKAKVVREEIAQATVDKSPFPPGQTLIMTGTKSWVLDAFTKRYFLSDYETLRKAQNDLNKQILHDDTATLSDFYELIGLEPTQMSDDVGWNTDELMELNLENAALTPESSVYPPPKVPCVVMTYRVKPIRMFHSNFRSA